MVTTQVSYSVKKVYVDGLEVGDGNDKCLASTRSAVSEMKCLRVRGV